MDSLVDSLQPYKELVASVAAIVTAMQMFSGFFVCWDMKKRGSSDVFSIIPFLGGLVMGALNLKYGMLIRDDTILRINFLGIALSLIYLMVYFQYAKNKGSVWMKIGIGGAIVAAVLGYAEMENPHVVEERLGVIITVFLFALIGSPLLFLGEIFANKSTDGLPFPMILTGTLVTFMWLLYGIILRNGFLIFQNVVGFGLSAFQLSLFAIFPSTPIQKKKAKKDN